MVTVTQHGRKVMQLERNLVDIFRNSPAAMYVKYDTLAFETIIQLDLRYGITQKIKVEEAPLDHPPSEDFPSEQQWSNDNPLGYPYNSYTKRDYQERKNDDVRQV